MAASKQLHHDDPSSFDKRWCVVFSDLTDDQIMWLSHRHNVTHSFHKAMSLKDKVVQKLYQIFLKLIVMNFFLQLSVS